MVNIFKGYIPTNGKTPLEKVIGATLLPDPPEQGDYAGVLKEEYVQIDFDNADDASLALKVVQYYKLKCNILETSRGIHLYFKTDNYHESQAVGSFTAMGLKCDLGLGNKNRVVPLRITKEEEVERIVNGVPKPIKTKSVVERNWLQTYDEVDVIPPYFRVISKHDFKFRSVETRNQVLYDYILKLQFHSFTVEEIRKTLKVINSFMLYEPLSDRELDVITRDDAFKEEIFFTEKGGFLHHRFGDYMLANSNIVMIDEIPHIYTKDYVYSASQDDFERAMLSKIPTLKESQRKEVYKYIVLKASRKVTTSSPNLIAVRNGVLDLKTMELTPFSPNHIITNRINVDYDATAYNELVDKTLNKIAQHQPDLRSLMEEMIGYTLYRKNIMQSCFILTGEGANGKSTFLNMIKRLLGKSNYTSLELKDLEDNFKPAEMYNKLANIGDDISAKFIENSSIFKKAVTGESFMVSKKYGQPFEMSCYATQIFSANQLPHVNDKSDGFSRRIVIVPFNAKFSKTDEDYNPFIEEELSTEEASQYMLKLAIDGLLRIIENREFTKTEAGEREKAEYLLANNNILEYLEENPKIENEPVNEVYVAYTVWCTRNGAHAVKKSNFTQEIRRKLGYTTGVKWDGGEKKNVRVYCK